MNTELAEEVINSVFIPLSEDVSDLKAIITSPIKYTKLKNNLKQWAKYKLDIAAVDMDAIRKKEAASKNPEGIDREKLDTAIKAKKAAIKGKMDAVDDRIAQLVGTDDSLRLVARLGKSKASLESNRKLLKIAQGEENDALRIKLEDQIEQDKENVTDAEDKLKTYAKNKPENDETPTSSETKPETKPSPAKKEEPKKEEPKKEEPVAKKEEGPEAKKDDVKEEPKKEETSDTKAEEKPVQEPEKESDEIEQIKKDIQGLKDKPVDHKFDKGMKDSVIAQKEKELEAARAKEKEKQSGEKKESENQPLDNSVSENFRQLMRNAGMLR